MSVNYFEIKYTKWFLNYYLIPLVCPNKLYYVVISTHLSCCAYFSHGNENKK